MIRAALGDGAVSASLERIWNGRGFTEMAPDVRKEIAEYLYGGREWTMVRIARGST